MKPRLTLVALIAFTSTVVIGCSSPPVTPSDEVTAPIPTPSVKPPTPEPKPTSLPESTPTQTSIQDPQATESEAAEDSVNPGCLEQPKGRPDADFIVDIFDPDQAYLGTTILPDNHIASNPRIIEVNMAGEIVWEYPLPEHLRPFTNPGFDVELLGNNNVLFLLPGNGVYEINRDKETVWFYLDEKVSHDADRLANGNTLIAFGNNDTKSDPQVKEVDPQGEIVWSWYARDHFDTPPYNEISDGGWTHTNAVLRLPSGNTLISPRNFGFLVEVDQTGNVTATYGKGVFRKQHDPVVLPTGNILVANHARPHRAVEIDPKQRTIAWQSLGFEEDNSPVRDANRLPNGNTLITGTTAITEVTPSGEIVWRFKFSEITFSHDEARGRGFYKANRICWQS